MRTLAGKLRPLEPLLAIERRRFPAGALDHVTARYGRNTATHGRRGRNQLCLGRAYCAQGRIEIHPVLGLPVVPDYVIRQTIHHELCHVLVPPGDRPDGRVIRAHGPEFQACNERFPERDRALMWREQHALSGFRHLLRAEADEWAPWRAWTWQATVTGLQERGNVPQLSAPGGATIHRAARIADTGSGWTWVLKVRATFTDQRPRLREWEGRAPTREDARAAVVAANLRVGPLRTDEA